jgi:hypothetical protein
MHQNQLIRTGLRLAGITLFAAAALNPVSVYSQGCVIARGASACTLSHTHDSFLQPGGWQATVSHRWFKSDRHFVGKEEQTHRQANGTEVINDSHFIDLIGTYAFTPQLSANLVVPFVVHYRSSLYEHKGNASGERYATRSSGLADMRAGINYWVIDPEKYKKGNIGFGIGIKAPTGDYEDTDIFERPTGPMLRYVDSSIQPGDGGWGFYLETQGYHQIVGNLSAYMNGSYLFNPRERVPSTGFSVPDSYLGRLGLAYAIWPKYGVALTLGGRIEGVPPEDAIGGSLGSRRPGYSLGIEPGIGMDFRRFSLFVSAPVAIERNRQRTFNAANTGDAAFADYSINSALSYRF